MSAETLYAVIPEQDTYFSIADRSLSRLRGSPLPGTGCLGPGSCVGAVVSAVRCCGGYAAGAHLGWLCRCDLDWVLGLSLALARLSCRVLLRRLCRRYALRLAVPPGVRLGAWAVVLRWCVCPAGCSCGGYAAGARLGWLRRLGLGLVRGPLSCVGTSVLPAQGTGPQQPASGSGEPR